MRRHDKVAVRTDGGRRAAEKSLPLHPDLLLLRALRPEAATHEKSSLKRELFASSSRKEHVADKGMPAGEGRDREPLSGCAVVLPVP